MSKWTDPIKSDEGWAIAAIVATVTYMILVGLFRAIFKGIR